MSDPGVERLKRMADRNSERREEKHLKCLWNVEYRCLGEWRSSNKSRERRGSDLEGKPYWV